MSYSYVVQRKVPHSSEWKDWDFYDDDLEGGLSELKAVIGRDKDNAYRLVHREDTIISVPKEVLVTADKLYAALNETAYGFTNNQNRAAEMLKFLEDDCG